MPRKRDGALPMGSGGGLPGGGSDRPRPRERGRLGTGALGVIYLLAAMAPGCFFAAKEPKSLAAPSGPFEVERRTETLPLRKALAAIASEALLGPDLDLHILAADSIQDVPFKIRYIRHVPRKPDADFPEPSRWRTDWRDALHDAADRVHADIWPLGEETLLLVPRQPVTVRIRDAAADIVLDLLFRGQGATSVLPDADLGEVNVDFRGAPLRRALAEVCAKQGILVSREGRCIYRVSTPEHERRIARRPLPPETLNALGLGHSHADRRDRVTLRGGDTMASEFLAAITEATTIPLGIDEGLDRTITLDLETILWRDALEVIAWKTGGVVWDGGDGSVRIRDIPRCSGSAETALHVVLDLVAWMGGVRLEVSPEISGGSRIDARGAPWRDVLYSLSRKVPFHLRVKPDGTFVAEPF